MEQTNTEIKLTQYSRGAGCGCKIAPAVLEQILKNSIATPDDKKLLVGNSSKDDAAVYDLGNGSAIISTTDFFMPIVDDPYDFGRIAAANAISDVYAMGGSPLLAVAILGWPVDKLPAEIAQKVIAGGKATCAAANIPLAGGHSIDTQEPMFGLAVTGLMPVANLKRNDTAREGDLLFLTKPLGVGVLSTAQKRGVITPELAAIMVEQMTSLNKIGEQLGAMSSVHAMTDVTGFGLLGHLIEMTEGSGLSAYLSYSAIQILPGVKEYMAQRIVPDATYRNWNSYSTKVKFEPGVDVMQAFNLLPDPQTNGGLLISVAPEAAEEIMHLFEVNGLAQCMHPIGKMITKDEKTVVISA
ncbi:MAG: selenide, water dikinase SelD [Bacteroidetes bacterium]|nr:selenide, water dikinase SelD [Bacteroidota bacterium]